MGAERVLGALVLVAVLGATGVSVYACGRWFPNRFLGEDEETVLRAPRPGWNLEEIIGQPIPSHSFGRDPRVSTVEADLADLKEALRETGTAKKRTLAAYSRLRRDLSAYLEWRDALRTKLQGGWLSRSRRHLARPRLPTFTVASTTDSSQPAFLSLADLSPPSGLPKEFELYLRGALLWHRGWKGRAREVWRQLLALPKARRHYRSTWAAFMIAKSYREIDSTLAADWYERTRELAADGFADRLGLAADSAGDQARLALDRRDYAHAVELYLEQHAQDGSALNSLAFTMKALFRDPAADWIALARHPTARRVVTGYLLSHGGSYVIRGSSESAAARWAEALERASSGPAAEADRLAWSFYCAGHYDDAARWLERAEPDSAIAQWLRSKLLLREGKMDQAVELLAGIAHELPSDPATGGGYPDRSQRDLGQYGAARVQGELGVLELSRGEFDRALELLLASHYWWDAAYVAERVLTVEELQTHVDRRSASGVTSSESSGRLDLTTEIRYLLARRLTRLGRWQDARSYYPEKWQLRLDEYIAGIRRGHDTTLPPAERAEAFWTAAKIARHEGMELLGTELEPDWAIMGGHGSPTPVLERRGKLRETEAIFASVEELSRAERHHPEPQARFHYRYIAADHAWRAAELMPDETVETANLLCTAGSWLKAKDPQAADRFYKALVWRCRSTELGKKADELRWFPPLPSQ